MLSRAFRRVRRQKRQTSTQAPQHHGGVVELPVHCMIGSFPLSTMTDKIRDYQETINRPSKLKRRRRNQKSPPSSTNPVARFAAEGSKDESGTGTGTGSGRDAGSQVDTTTRLSTNTTLLERDDIASPAQILNLNVDNEKGKGKYSSSKTISAEIDYFIATNPYSYGRNKRDDATAGLIQADLEKERTKRLYTSKILGGVDKTTCSGVRKAVPPLPSKTENEEEKNDWNQKEPVEVHHSILGSIELNGEIHIDAHQCHLAFPRYRQAAIVKSHHHRDMCRRGDGIIVSGDKLAFPTASESSDSPPKPNQNVVKMIKIVSEYGATIRQDYDIIEDAQSSIGKLPFGSVRVCTEWKWLLPPAIDVDIDDSFDCDESRLVGVMRYKIRLLSYDTNGQEEFGWISDRSRLYDDPYVIADVQQ